MTYRVPMVPAELHSHIVSPCAGVGFQKDVEAEINPFCDLCVFCGYLLALLPSERSLDTQHQCIVSIELRGWR